jgi:dCTP diphosphatase
MASVGISEMSKLVSEFVRERNWEKFHNPKDLAIAISVEASELLELFQWTGKSGHDAPGKEEKARIAEELADVIIYSLSMANSLNIDLSQAIRRKMEANKNKYPVDKWKDVKEWRK